MLSSFLKKLLFARQFFMIDGKIEVLGKRQIMLPSSFVEQLEKCSTEQTYNSIRELAKKEMKDYVAKLANDEEGIIGTANNIFETYGLGKLEIMKVNYQKKAGIIRVRNPYLVQSAVGKNRHQITSAIIAGIFSYVFKKKVDSKLVNNPELYSTYCEYAIK